MKKNSRKILIFSLFVVVVLLAIFPATALAAPGGMIVKAATKTLWGKLLLAALAIILLPLIIYFAVREALAVSRTRRDLQKLTEMNGLFRWSFINERAYAVVSQVHAAWKKTDLEKAKEWMTHWFWQNQKLLYLEQWEESGLANHCKLKRIVSVKPLRVEYDEKEPGDGEGSRVVLMIKVNLQDYLAEKDTGTIVEGDELFKDHESIWTLLLENGQWKLSMINESNLSLLYSRMKNDLGDAREHLLTGHKFQGKKDQSA
jgi:hypothetical protein